MPHKRKVKREHETRLVFEAGQCDLYLPVGRVCDESLEVPLSTLLVLFVLEYVEAAGSINLHLVQERLDTGEDVCVRVRRGSLQFSLCSSLPPPVARCRLPVWYLPRQRTCVAGLCSVVRYALKLTAATSSSSGSRSKVLLGFQYNCLSAPAEVSTWTKFCEVELPEATRTLLLGTAQLPRELSKFEAHMRQPIRMHNVRKKMQQTAGSSLNTFIEGTSEVKFWEDGQRIDPIKIYAQEQHVYAEGPDLLISDLLLFPCYHLMKTLLHGSLPHKFPLTHRWFEAVSEKGAGDVMDRLLLPLQVGAGGQDWSDVEPALVADESLYKCDPKRVKTAKSSFTRQADVIRNIEWWKSSQLESLQVYSGEGGEEGLDWSSLPRLVHPQAGCLPPDRLERKCQQLEGLALPLTRLARARGVLHLTGRGGDRDTGGVAETTGSSRGGDTADQKEKEEKEGVESPKLVGPGNGGLDGEVILVDFCSGGGHLGLLLAHLLPQVTVHMVENKEESLARARERGVELGLSNVWFYQSNIEYYQGQFSVGASLHACGVATDLVIQKAIKAGADFAAVPCCYGAVQSIPGSVEYPRSLVFRSANCSEQDYLVMGHTADQTHKGGEKEEQGEMFMDIVDTDRALACIEAGYTVILDKLHPLSSSPKHNLIVARLSH